MGYTVVPNQISNLSGIDDVNLSSVSQGEILYRNGSNEWTNLGTGNSGEALTTQGTGNNPIWSKAGRVELVDSNTISSSTTTLIDSSKLDHNANNVKYYIVRWEVSNDGGSGGTIDLYLNGDTDNSNYGHAETQSSGGSLKAVARGEPAVAGIGSGREGTGWAKVQLKESSDEVIIRSHSVQSGVTLSDHAVEKQSTSNNITRLELNVTGGPSVGSGQVQIYRVT